MVVDIDPPSYDCLKYLGREGLLSPVIAGDLDRALFFVTDVDAADEGREGLSE